MVDNVDVHIGQMLGNLTMNIVKTSTEIEQIQKLFSDCKIVLEENYAEDFVTALTKLFALINMCEKAVCGKSYFYKGRKKHGKKKNTGSTI